MPLAFDDAGRPVPVEHPAVYDDQGSKSSPAVDAEQLIIAMMAGAKNSAEAGERVFVIGYVMKLDGAPANLRDLGAILGVSHTGAGLRVARVCRDLQPFLLDMVAKEAIGDE
jgi:hypothetical protein